MEINMSDFDFELPTIEDEGTVTLCEEDKKRVIANQVEWYKGEKNQTDRVALVYFSTLDVTTLKRALKERPDLTVQQKREIVLNLRAALAKKLGKEESKLDAVDLLDLNEVKFRKVKATYKQGLGFVSWPVGKLPPEDENVWLKLGDPREYLTTILLVYPTNKDGELDKERFIKGGWKVLPWRFNPDLWHSILRINNGLKDSNASVSKWDLHLTCKDPKYQSITIAPAGGSAYQVNDKFRRVILEKAVGLYSKLNPFREMSTEKLREELGLPPPIIGDSVANDLDFSSALANV
jgi:hypothetical protein